MRICIHFFNVKLRKVIHCVWLKDEISIFSELGSFQRKPFINISVFKLLLLLPRSLPLDEGSFTFGSRRLGEWSQKTFMNKRVHNQPQIDEILFVMSTVPPTKCCQIPEIWRIMHIVIYHDFLNTCESLKSFHFPNSVMKEYLQGPPSNDVSNFWSIFNPSSSC